MFSIARPAAHAIGVLLAFAASTTQAGEFSVQLRAASDDTMMGLPSCRVDYTASNGMDAAVRRGSFRVLPLAVEGSTTASVSAASGESLANIGPVASGASTENSFKVRGAPCKNLNGLKLVAFHCVREPDKGNCNANMAVSSAIAALPLIIP
ncbi:hypothetical protein [Dokdonella sp.]|uniref:hypothetical protein n=1 Tax=Dokdonella sp. TaxID=2291710 RepID=UPI003526DB29